MIRTMLKGKFVFLFLVLLIAVFITPYFIASSYYTWILTGVTDLLIIAIVFAMVERTRLFILACLLAFVIIVIDVIISVQTSEWLVLIHNVLALLFYAFAVIVILKKILSAQRADLNLIFASLSAYMLIALVYANLYSMVELLNPGSFMWNSDLYTIKNVSGFDLVYFSFTTLTTVGFGDILPMTIQAKSIVIIEEITGIFYLAALVSRLVADLSR